MNGEVSILYVVFILLRMAILIPSGIVLLITGFKVFNRVSYYYEEPAQFLKESGFEDLGERMEYAMNRRKYDWNKPYSIFNLKIPVDISMKERVTELKMYIEYIQLPLPKTEENGELLKRQRVLKFFFLSLLGCFIGQSTLPIIYVLSAS